jgi:hypothetical protein
MSWYSIYLKTLRVILLSRLRPYFYSVEHAKGISKDDFNIDLILLLLYLISCYIEHQQQYYAGVRVREVRISQELFLIITCESCLAELFQSTTKYFDGTFNTSNV